MDNHMLYNTETFIASCCCIVFDVVFFLLYLLQVFELNSHTQTTFFVPNTIICRQIINIFNLEKPVESEIYANLK